eukprot:718702-Pyramimonas_sp.AAC.1
MSAKELSVLTPVGIDGHFNSGCNEVYIYYRTHYPCIQTWASRASRAFALRKQGARPQTAMRRTSR